ncbi:hypothetical protein M3Y99_01878300 [Aphelenchoides fujianensis]|nr:hypothetical protein M3Y99_01878300 [Aphelenchoides fujianensis]
MRRRKWPLLLVFFFALVLVADGKRRERQRERGHGAKARPAPMARGVINRQLFRDLFVDHSNVSLVLRPDGASLRAVQNERHALDCRSLECAAVFLRKAAPVALEIVLESRAVHHLGEPAVLCDAIDGTGIHSTEKLERLEFISLRLRAPNGTRGNETEGAGDSLALQLMFCLPDRIVEFAGFMPEIVGQFAARRPLALFFLPAARRPDERIDFPKLLQINAHRVVLDESHDLAAVDFAGCTSLLRPNPVLRSLVFDVSLGRSFTLLAANQSAALPRARLEAAVRALASLSEPTAVLEAVREVVDAARLVVDGAAALGVVPRSFLVAPLLALEPALVADGGWLDATLGLLLDAFRLEQFATPRASAPVAQLQGRVHRRLITLRLTIAEHHPARDPAGTNRRLVKELVRRLQHTIHPASAERRVEPIGDRSELSREERVDVLVE